MSFGTPAPPPMIVAPQAPAAPPLFGSQQPKKNPSQGRSMNQTFLGTAAAPQAGQLGQKTLLGQ